jgi:hypothetical protein
LRTHVDDPVVGELEGLGRSTFSASTQGRQRRAVRRDAAGRRPAADRPDFFERANMDGTVADQSPKDIPETWLGTASR